MKLAQEELDKKAMEAASCDLPDVIITQRPKRSRSKNADLEDSEDAFTEENVDVCGNGREESSEELNRAHGQVLSVSGITEPACSPCKHVFSSLSSSTELLARPSPFRVTYPGSSENSSSPGISQCVEDPVVVVVVVFSRNVKPTTLSDDVFHGIKRGCVGGL